MKHTIVPAEKKHVEKMAPMVRIVDVQEIWAMSHQSPAEALTASLGPHAHTALDEAGEPFAMFGVVEVGSLLGAQVAFPWLIGTDMLNHKKLSILKESRTFMNSWKKRYTALMNFVDSRNLSSIQWLRALGFTIHPAKPMGPDGTLFHFFDWNRNV